MNLADFGIPRSKVYIEKLPFFLVIFESFKSFSKFLKLLDFYSLIRNNIRHYTCNGRQNSIDYLSRLGRLIALPLCGFILFFQGWRLDPILQFGQFLLAIGIVFESSVSILSDCLKRRVRTGREAAELSVKTQPTDVAE